MPQTGSFAIAGAIPISPSFLTVGYLSGGAAPGELCARSLRRLPGLRHSDLVHFHGDHIRRQGAAAVGPLSSKSILPDPEAIIPTLLYRATTTLIQSENVFRSPKTTKPACRMLSRVRRLMCGP